MSISTHVACIVLAGGQGNRLHELTQSTCKPAVSFGETNLMVDWTLDNVRRSGICNTVVATQYLPDTLTQHLNKIWSNKLDGGLQIAHGPKLTGRNTGYHGTADAVRQNLPELLSTGVKTVVVVGADHIYEMDYRPMIEAHEVSGAGITVGVTLIEKRRASTFGIVQPGPKNLIRGFLEKPRNAPSAPGHPDHAMVSMGIYVCDLEWLAAQLKDAGDDFGYDILPRAVASQSARYFAAIPAQSSCDVTEFYWKDIGTLDSYRETALDLIVKPSICPAPIVKYKSANTNAARYWAQFGTVIMRGGSIAKGAIVRNAIIGPNVHISSEDIIGVDFDEDAKWFRLTEDGTVLVTESMIKKRALRLEERQRRVLASVSSSTPHTSGHISYDKHQ